MSRGVEATIESKHLEAGSLSQYVEAEVDPSLAALVSGMLEQACPSVRMQVVEGEPKDVAPPEDMETMERSWSGLFD